ncbi:MAG TPA: TIGR03118 family protein, partial [Gaiellales bacterium]|nr:TIGR03118 family protein [Gaiellales bacterium]
GRVAIFNRRGHLMRRLVTGGSLNAPWGLARAPSGFGKFSRDFLVGNFGDGLINAFDPQTGQWEGALRRPNGALLRNDGLWAIRFGNSVTGGNHTLLFSAGIDDETHGLLGAIRFHP